jgi:hypothetical protein
MNLYFESDPQGLWMGIIVALVVQALALSIITLRIDWEKEVNYFDMESCLYNPLLIISSDIHFSFFCNCR